MQLCTVFRHWRFTVLEKTLKVDEIPKIMTFCEHVMTRQVALFEEYSSTFPNIYKDRVKEYIRPAPDHLLIQDAQRICKTNESPDQRVTACEDVEMMDEGSDLQPCAQTFDDRRSRHYNTNGAGAGQAGLQDMMIIQ